MTASAEDPAGTGPARPRTHPRLPYVLGFLLLAVALIWQAASGPREGGPLRKLWFDTLQQLQPRERVAQPAVVVNIDQASLDQWGQWPWPRQFIAELVAYLDAAGASAIAFDVLFSEPDRFSFRNVASLAPDPEVAEALSQLYDSDEVLADHIAEARVVLAAAGLFTDRNAISDAEKPLAPLVTLEDVDPSAFLSFNFEDGPLEILRNSARGVGAITRYPSTDRVLRRVPLVQNLDGRTFVLLGAEARRIADDGFFTVVRPGTIGLSVDLGETRVPVESNGDFWLHMGKRDVERYISFKDLVAQREGTLEAVRDRIALVAVTGLGTLDLQLSPLREEVYGIEAHLQVLEQIAEERFLRRPDILFLGELALTLALCAAIILWVPRARPQIALPALLLLIGGALGASILAFQQGWLIDTASSAMSGGVIAFVLTGITLVERDRARLMNEAALQSARADNARLEGQLSAAGRIQANLLPASRFALDRKLDLACFIQPAQAVGGDFYDQFMIDDGRLFFVVGDVSGKGVDASFFMVLSKVLWKSVALRPGMSLATLQTQANIEISRENADMMFVTGLVGLMDVETGMLEYSSAGHETPFRFSPGAQPERLEECAGPPVGLDPGAEYPVGRTHLAPGEGLCIFTDGVSEAEDLAQERYGVERLEACLAGLPPKSSAAEVVAAVRTDVARFAGEAPPSDDLTLMVVIRPADCGGTVIEGAADPA